MMRFHNTRLMTAVGLILIFFYALIGSGKASLSEDELQTQTKEVAKTLRCAVCQSESVWESNAELALQMREIIREKLQQGESPDQIRAYFVSRYGDFILLKPRTFGLNWLLWAGPFLLLLLGSFFLFKNIKTWTDKTASLPPEDLSAINEEERKKIQQELNSFKS